MRPFLCRRRPAAPSRLIFVSAFLAVLPAAARAADSVVSGVVEDQSGRAVPRAYIRVLDGATPPRAVFADERGRFEVPVIASLHCRVEVTLAGFAPALADCAAFPADRPLRVELRVAPVREDVLVTATRTDAPASQVGASATVFTAGDLERRQMPMVADLVATTPGAMVMRSGGPGSLTSLFVRGGESDYNKILLDGVPLNEPGGSFYLNSLTTEHLDRVEIVRGAYSSLFGSDAMASVIQLFTRRAHGAPPRTRAAVQIDGGSYGTLHTSASVSGAAGRLDYAAGAARFSTDNRMPNSALDTTTLSGNVGVGVGQAGTLRVLGRAELEHVGTPGPTAFGRPDLDAFFERADGIFSVSFDRETTPAARQHAAYSIASSRQTSTNLIADPPYTAAFRGRLASFPSTDFPSDTHGDLRRHQASYQLDLRLPSSRAAGDHRVTILGNWDGERATLQDRLAGTTATHARDNFGASVQHQALWRRLFTTVGARVEHNDSFGAAFVPRATVVFVARESSLAVGDTRLKVSAGTGIKEPTLLESFSVSPFFLGNPDLRPERSRSIEAGLDQRLAGNRAKIELTWFHNRFSDIISLRTDPTTFQGQYFNVGVTRARGLELGVHAAPAGGVSLRATYTLLDSKIVETTAPGNVLFAPGQWAFWRPRHSGSAGVAMEYGRLAADLNGVFVGRFVDSDFGLFAPPLTENPGHAIWDARVSVRVTARLRGVLMIDNLTDARYSEPFGYEPLGRAVRAGARVSF